MTMARMVELDGPAHLRPSRMQPRASQTATGVSTARWSRTTTLRRDLGRVMAERVALTKNRPLDAHGEEFSWQFENPA